MKFSRNTLDKLRKLINMRVICTGGANCSHRLGQISIHVPHPVPVPIGGGGGVAVKPVKIMQVHSTTFDVLDLNADGTVNDGGGSPPRPNDPPYSVFASTMDENGVLGGAALTDCVNVPVVGGVILVWYIKLRVVAGNPPVLTSDWWTVNTWKKVCAAN